MDLHLLSVQIPSQLNSNFKSLCTEACEMSLNPFFASIFTMLYDALISQLLCFRASTTDLLFWLWLGCSCFYSRNLVLLWTWQSQGWGAIFQRKPSHPQYTWRLCLLIRIADEKRRKKIYKQLERWMKLEKYVVMNCQIISYTGTRNTGFSLSLNEVK